MVSEQGYGEDAESGCSYGLHHVLLATPAGSEEALRSFSVGVLGMAEVAKPPLSRHAAGLGRAHEVPYQLERVRHRTSVMPVLREAAAIAAPLFTDTGIRRAGSPYP